MRVYCKQCKYHKWIEEYSMKQVCKLSKLVRHHPECEGTYYTHCSVLNKNNDCKNYKTKWFLSFAAKFKRSSIDDPEYYSRFEILDL